MEERERDGEIRNSEVEKVGREMYRNREKDGRERDRNRREKRRDRWRGGWRRETHQPLVQRQHQQYTYTHTQNIIIRTKTNSRCTGIHEGLV